MRNAGLQTSTRRAADHPYFQPANVLVAPHGANFADEVYFGYPGLVKARDQARAMTWGFPRILTGKKGQKPKPRPVTYARDDNLQSLFWRASFEKRRCLIPVSQWAEPEGEERHMTRTCHAVSGDKPFAVAGLWRPGDE